MLTGVSNYLVRFWQTRAAARGARRVGHAHGADVPARGARACTRPGASSTTSFSSSSTCCPRWSRRPGFAVAKAPGYEADDFLGAAVTHEEARGGTVLVATSDRDAFQLASKQTSILQPVRGEAPTRIGPDEVRERYGVDPEQVPDFIALRGDPSDRIPGARGIGPKRAAELLAQYGTLDALLAEGRFAAEADALRLYRRIATLDREAPLPPLPDAEPDWAAAAEHARELGMDGLARRFEEARAWR